MSDDHSIEEEVEAAKKEIVRVVKEKVSYVSWVELLECAPSLKGDLLFHQGTLVYWNGVTKACILAMNELIESEVIEPYSCSMMIYLLDNETLNLPIARRQKFDYKTDHWYPVTFSKGECSL